MPTRAARATLARYYRRVRPYRDDLPPLPVAPWRYGTGRGPFLSPDGVPLFVQLENEVLTDLKELGGTPHIESTKRFLLGPGVHVLPWYPTPGGGRDIVALDRYSRLVARMTITDPCATLNDVACVMADLAALLDIALATDDAARRTPPVWWWGYPEDFTRDADDDRADDGWKHR